MGASIVIIIVLAVVAAICLAGVIALVYYVCGVKKARRQEAPFDDIAGNERARLHKDSPQRDVWPVAVPLQVFNRPSASSPSAEDTDDGFRRRSRVGGVDETTSTAEGEIYFSPVLRTNPPASSKPARQEFRRHTVHNVNPAPRLVAVSAKSTATPVVPFIRDEESPTINDIISVDPTRAPPALTTHASIPPSTHMRVFDTIKDDDDDLSGSTGSLRARPQRSTSNPRNNAWAAPSTPTGPSGKM